MATPSRGLPSVQIVIRAQSLSCRLKRILRPMLLCRRTFTVEMIPCAQQRSADPSSLKEASDLLLPRATLSALKHPRFQLRSGSKQISPSQRSVTNKKRKKKKKGLTLTTPHIDVHHDTKGDGVFCITCVRILTDRHCRNAR